MKIRTMTLTAFLLCAMSGCNRKTDSQTNVEIIGGVAETNVGTVDKNSNMLSATEWLLQNTGNAELRIDSIKPSCDCMEMKYDKSMTAKSGKYFPVRAILHPEEVDTGAFIREVEVYGNFPSSPLVLTMRGRIVDQKK